MTTAPNDSAPAIFLDRDGTLMREVNYCSDPKLVEIFPGVPAALLKLKALGTPGLVTSHSLARKVAKWRSQVSLPDPGLTS